MFCAARRRALGFIEVDMYNAPVREDHIENIPIPEGDPGEQLVANLILSVIVCQLHTLPNAIAYIAKAHELAVGLQSQTITYRPKNPSKFARAEFELHGTTQVLLLSLINNVLVMPPIGSTELAKVAATAGVAINLKNLDVAHFMLRLRTRRLVAALEPLKTMDSPEELTDATRRILAKCFYREIISEEPLSRTDDCFMLARALIGKRNFQMAALVLKNANSELESYVRSIPLRELPPKVQRMKEQIAEIIKELGSGAA
jgi:hypothetical protein